MGILGRAVLGWSSIDLKTCIRLAYRLADHTVQRCYKMDTNIQSLQSCAKKGKRKLSTAKQLKYSNLNFYIKESDNNGDSPNIS